MEKRYEHSQYDEQMRQLWQQNNVYSCDRTCKKVYSIDTPPPTVSGSLHIGHIFSYTQTDIIARYKRMTGHAVFYPYGFDCNGLATERFVEKKHDTSVYKIGRDEFVKLCLSTSKEAEQSFVDLWQQMGLSADFTTTYSTISPDVQKIAQESFLRLAEKNFVYTKEEPAMYCTTMRTSVAQAELEDEEKETFFTDLAFGCTNGSEIIISTTRPELLPSCVALIFNPNDDRYKHLAAEQAIVPIYGYQVPILQDEAVQIEKGTGLVMVCTFGDKTDVEWWKKFKLPYKQSVGLDGKWTELTGALAGLKVEQARAKILELLQEHNVIRAQKKIKHSVSIYERSKKEIEYVILPQWFVKIIDYKNELLALADTINWYPYHMKSRFKNWVENLNWDWCISRQRVFGIPFPVWYDATTGTPVFASLDELPINPMTSFPKNYSGDTKNLIPEKDVMDTWNTSSLTPYICKKMFSQKDGSPFEDETFLPMAMRPQAHDIIRTWAFYTIVKSWMHDHKIPWKDIVISGYVLSTAKEKISKSKGNAPTQPAELLKLYAPDAIRYWTASGTLGQDIAFSEDQIQIGQKLMNKLWNAYKFALPYLQDYTPNSNHNTQKNVVNAWMLLQIQECTNKVHAYFEKYEFGLALQTIETLFWRDYCDNYIEIIKDQFFNKEAYSEEEMHETLYTLYHAGLSILQLYAPYLPHITEKLYQRIYASHEKIVSLHQTHLLAHKEIETKNIHADMNVLLHIISEVRKLKTAHQLALKTPLQTLAIYNVDTAKDMLVAHEKIIKGISKAEQIVYHKKSVESNLEGIEPAIIMHVTL